MPSIIDYEKYIKYKLLTNDDESPVVKSICGLSVFELDGKWIAQNQDDEWSEIELY